MSTTFQDYYETLGVTPTATRGEIKKAFHRLARQFHPDVAADKSTADENFKKINEANSVLSDPLKRRHYDDLRAGGGMEEPQSPAAAESQSAGRRWAGGAGAEFHFSGNGFSDFFERHFGGRSGFDFASGRGDAADPSRETADQGGDLEGEILVSLEEVLHGTRRSISLQTIDPLTGHPETRSFQVRVPPGATQGRRLRIPGKGTPGHGGAAPGDLYLRVRYAEHPDFQTQGPDLLHEIALAPWEAVLGASIQCPAFEGPIKVRVPAATKEGQILRVRGRGLPNGRPGTRGDLLIRVRLQVPDVLTPEERALWEELGRVSTFHPRQSP